MAVAECSCGGTVEVGEDAPGRPLSCPFCNRTLRVVIAEGAALEGSFNARLTIAAGPDRVGEQVLLCGGGTIGIGKLATTPIRFTTPLVSRLHCELRRTPAGGWVLADRNSANGLFVNGLRVSSRTLQSGDVIYVGEYELHFDQSA